MSSRRRRVFGATLVSLTTLGGCASVLGLDEPEFASTSEGQSDAAFERTGAPGADGSSTDGSSSGSLDAKSDADANADADGGTQPPLTGLLDDFNRPNSLAVGNNWIEKVAGVFDLVNGAAEMIVNTDYRDAIVYRPSSEDVLDVTVGLTFVGDKEIGTPLLLARLQSASANTAQSFTAYFATVGSGNASALQIFRLNGGITTLLAEKNLGLTLAVKTSYRMTLLVKNNGNFVLTTATLRELPSGALLGAISSNDGLPQRITAPGSVGFGATTSTLSSHTRLDDFTRTSP